MFGAEGDKLEYHGGVVLYEPHVYAIFMGSNWNGFPGSGVRSQLESMYNQISGSAWQGILTQYFGAEGIVSHGVARTFYTDSSVQLSSPTDSEITAEARKVVAAQGWNLSPANDQVVVLLSPGTFGGSGSPKFCAEHSSETFEGVTVSFSTIPYLGDEPFYAVCSGYGYGLPAVATSMAASHEYAESVSDPFSGGGWHGPNNEEEVADLCVGSNAQLLPGGAWVNELWDNEQESCSMSDPNPPALHGVTGASTGITTTEATLNGKVNPGGLEASYYFEYGKSSFKYETKVPASPVSIGSGTSDIEVSKVATGLKPGTVYHWRVTVTNPRGTTHGHDATFTTEGPPLVTTEAASGSQKTSTTLNGTVNPNGKETKYFFEYGLTTGYGSKTAEVSIGSGKSDVNVSAEITGLTPKTLYHFRLVASNSFGSAPGSNRTVTTKASPPVVVTGTADGISASNATVHGTVNPEGFETTYFFEYGETSYEEFKTPELTLKAGTSPVEVSEVLSGLKEGTKYSYRLRAISTQGSVTDFSAHTLTTLKLPTATTEAASSLETANPHLNATVNPNGSETSYQFEYGLTEAYGSVTPLSPKGIGAGTSPVAVSQTLSGLKQNATYHFRIKAESPAGVAYGKDQSFTTISATGATDPASEVTATEAVLNGTVNPQGLETKYQFEYGTTTSYGQVAPAEAKSAGKGISNVGVHQTISGLKPVTTYHFRLVISNPDIGTVYGSDQAFTTGAKLRWFSCTKQTGGRYATNKCATETATKEWESLKLKEAEKTNITAKGNPITITATWGGVKGAVYCETEVTGASLENPSGGGNGIGNAELKYKGCKSEPNWEGCKVTPGAAIAVKLALTTREGKTEVLITPKTGTSLGSFTFSECTTSAFNGTKELSGTLRGAYSNSSSQVEFTTETMELGELKFNTTIKATAIGSIKLETSGGGYLAAQGAPVAKTEAATSIKSSEATLNGTVNPEGAATKYQFEYGKTTSYGQKAPAEAKEAGEGLTDVKVAETISGLVAATEYHYRLVATNGVSTAYGVDKTFTTSAPPLRWFACTKQAGGKYASATCATEGAPKEWESVLLKEAEKTSITAKGNPIAITATWGGIKGTINCETEVTGASLENPSGGGNGIGNAELKYKNCKVEPAEPNWVGCKVTPGGAIAVKLELTTREGKTEVLVTPKTGTSLGSFTFTECKTSALNGTKELGGTLRGVYSNSSSQVEFTTETMELGELKFNGTLKATAIGSIKLETSGGGYVKAG